MQFNPQRLTIMSKTPRLQPKVALITGAARRIGASIAHHLHAQGFNIIVHYHTSKTAAQALCAELNSLRANSAYAVKADLAKTNILANLIEKSAEKWGRLDCLINNAARFKQTTMGKITSLDFAELIDTNLKAPLFLAQAAAPHLAKTQGCIINIGDIHAERPMRHYPVYSISKAGLIMLTQSLARELAPAIRVNTISPGPTIWPEGKNTLSKAQQKDIINRTALKQHGDSDVLAKTVYFLIAEGTTITGQNLALDCGRSLFI
jgi:pteridine reductase